MKRTLIIIAFFALGIMFFSSCRSKGPACPAYATEIDRVNGTDEELAETPETNETTEASDSMNEVN